MQRKAKKDEESKDEKKSDHKDSGEGEKKYLSECFL